MTEDELESVTEQMENFGNYLRETEFTQSIVAEMCFVNEIPNDLAYSRNDKWKVQRRSMVIRKSGTAINSDSDSDGNIEV